MKVTYLSNLKAKVCLFRFNLFCFALFYLFVCFIFCVFWLQKLHCSENVLWRRKSSFRRHFSFLYRKSYLKRRQGKHRQCCSEYRYIWCRSFSGDGWNSCYLLGGYQGQIRESKFSVCVMTLASRSAKTKALNLSTGRRYFSPRFSGKHVADMEHNVPATLRFTSAPWSPLAWKTQHASTASHIFICYGYYVLHFYCLLHIFNPKGGNESTKTKLVDKFTKALPKLFGGLKVTIEQFSIECWK